VFDNSPLVEVSELIEVCFLFGGGIGSDKTALSRIDFREAMQTLFSSEISGKSNEGGGITTLFFLIVVRKVENCRFDKFISKNLVGSQIGIVKNGETG
jgi:hypothetical protein